MKRRCISDIETNGLLHELDTIWVACFIDIKTREEFIFSDLSVHKKARPIRDMPKFLDECSTLIGHNFLMFDVPAIELVTGYRYKGKVVDTLLLSQLFHFTRRTPMGAKGPHGLEAWGIRAKRYKPYVENWYEFDEGKVHRCMEDVHINLYTYKRLMEEAAELQLDKSVIAMEHKVAQLSSKQAANGWLVDEEFAKECIIDLDQQIKEIREEVEPRIPPVVKFKDGKATWEEVNDVLKCWKKVPETSIDVKGKVVKPAAMPKNVKFLKSGNYDRHTCNWFGIEPEDAKTYRPVMGPYTRIELEKVKLSQHAAVKDFLLTQGWQPTEWNFAKDSNGNIIKTTPVHGGRPEPVKASPKLTEDSLESINGELGKLIVKRNTLVSRRTVIQNPTDETKGWLNIMDDRKRVSCSPITLGTATGRMGHRGIVNIPGAKSVYGKQMRKIFTCPEDRILIGCDAASAQLRLLASDMGDPRYVKTVCDGIEEDKDENYRGTDVHTINTMAAGLVNKRDVEYCRDNPKIKDAVRKAVDDARAKGKGFIYAFLFGAGDMKLGWIVGTDQKGATEVRQRFMRGVPALNSLIEGLRDEYKFNKARFKEGFIEGLDGRRIYCNSDYKVLNYRLQSSEAIYMKWAFLLTEQYIQEKGLKTAKILCMMHDELNYEVHPDEADILDDCLRRAFVDAGVHLGLTCPMSGNPKKGKNWYDIH